MSHSSNSVLGQLKYSGCVQHVLEGVEVDLRVVAREDGLKWFWVGPRGTVFDAAGNCFVLFV